MSHSFREPVVYKDRLLPRYPYNYGNSQYFLLSSDAERAFIYEALSPDHIHEVEGGYRWFGDGVIPPTHTIGIPGRAGNASLWEYEVLEAGKLKFHFNNGSNWEHTFQTTELGPINSHESLIRSVSGGVSQYLSGLHGFQKAWQSYTNGNQDGLRQRWPYRDYQGTDFVKGDGDRIIGNNWEHQELLGDVRGVSINNDHVAAVIGGAVYYLNARDSDPALNLVIDIEDATHVAIDSEGENLLVQRFDDVYYYANKSTVEILIDDLVQSAASCREVAETCLRTAAYLRADQ